MASRWKQSNTDTQSWKQLAHSFNQSSGKSRGATHLASATGEEVGVAVDLHWYQTGGRNRLEHCPPSIVFYINAKLNALFIKSIVIYGIPNMA